jgi:hypothetical protein
MTLNNFKSKLEHHIPSRFWYCTVMMTEAVVIILGSICVGYIEITELHGNVYEK